MVQSGFGLSTVIMIVIAAAGYLTFGKNCDGFILNNYSTSDTLINVGGRAAISLSLLVTYPLIFTGLRDNVMDLYNVSPEERNDSTKLNSITSTLVAVLTMIATVVTGDLRTTLALSSAMMGCAITYIFPSLMYQQVIKKQQGRENHEGVDMIVATITTIIGILLSVVGVSVAVSSF